MQIHCAFCGRSFDKDVEPPYGTVDCPHCGKEFDLASRITVPYESGEESAPEGWPGKKFGGYRIEKEIGRGGMGVVFEAVQESLDRKVAVKVLYRASCEDPHFVARFEREAESLARLNHPNIVNILDRGCEEGIYYFVMEYVDGVSLRSLMDDGELSASQALSIVPPVCEALEYAHEQGVIHRDIKPENILVDRQGRVKIADFGLSRIIRGDEKESRITRSNMVMGTPDYMAPEQRESSKSVDHRADIYALGVIFYEMLTGELPLGHFPPPSEKAVRIDVRLDEIVLKVLDKDPERRYQRASDIATDLLKITAGDDGKSARKGMPEWTPAAGGPARNAPVPKPKRSFLEIIEDGWDSWVLGVLVVLTVVDFFPMVFLLVGWALLRKTVLRRREERESGYSPDSGPRARKPVPPKPPGAPGRAGGEVAIPVADAARERAAVAGSTPRPPAPPASAIEDPDLMGFEGARKALGVSGEDLEAMARKGELKAFPAPDGSMRFRAEDVAARIRSSVVKEGSGRAPAPRTSFLAILAAFYSLTLLTVFLATFLPFEDLILAKFNEVPIEVMPGVLSLAALAAVPGLLGLLLSAVAKSRVSVHSHLGGGFIALMALAASLVFLGVAARKWYDTFMIYRDWSRLEQRAGAGDPAVLEDLGARVSHAATRERALEVAGSLPAEQGRVFFQRAMETDPETARAALRFWAASSRHREDAESRRALIAKVREYVQRPEKNFRFAGLEALQNLQGPDATQILLTAVSDPGPEVRVRAAKVLSQWREPLLTGEALNLALDGVEDVSLWGFEAMERLEGRVPDAAWREMMGRVAAGGKNGRVRRKALKHLESLHRSGIAFEPELVERLQGIESGGDRSLERDLEKLLGEIREPRRKERRE